MPDEALRASETSLKEAQELAHVGSWTLELETKRLQWTDEVYRILELPSKPDVVSYAVFLQAVHPDDRAAVDQALRESARDQTPHDFEHRLLFADNRVKFIHERCRTVCDAGGRPVRILGTAQDITHRRELEEQMRQAQKMEAVGQLAGGAAHDFNNILAAITMQVELASLAENVPAEVREELQEIRAAATRAASLTRQLLVFSRRQIMQPQEIDLNEVVSHLGRMLQRLIGEHVHVEHRLHTTPLVVFADSGMLDQVLLNLVVNARDAMPDGGRIVVATGERVIPDDAVPADPGARAGRFACLSVRDSGSGIPPEILPRVFEPFFTTKEAGKGTGLGLATVAAIVRQHQGWIGVQTRVGAGTCIEVNLPLSDRTAPTLEQTATQPLATGGSETILFVEDDPDVRTTTRDFLERHGYRVLEAMSGAGAIRIWTKHAMQIDILITDLVLPDGVRGATLARRLRSEAPRLGTILMSGYAADTDSGQMATVDRAIFLQKPFKAEALLAAIRSCLSR